MRIYTSAAHYLHADGFAARVGLKDAYMNAFMHGVYSILYCEESSLAAYS
jgi:hypothetical protein